MKVVKYARSVGLPLSCLAVLGALAFCKRAPADDQPNQSGAPSPSAPPSVPAKWESVLARIAPERNAVSGEWTKSADGLRVAAATGARLSIPVAPPREYDVRIAFTRHSGRHSIAIFFPHGSGQASFEVDAWGDHVAGIQNIQGRPITSNPTRQANIALTNGRRYTMTVEVRTGQVRALLDERVLATYRTDGSDLAVPELWSMPDRHSLGLGAWESETTFHSVDIRTVSGAPLQVATATRPATKPSPPSNAPTSNSPPARKTTPVATPSSSTNGRAAGKRVLLVIANYDFFYREYSEPRAAMERAGINVTVAAGRKERCTPHSGSGEGADRGVVQPDIAIVTGEDDISAAEMGRRIVQLLAEAE